MSREVAEKRAQDDIFGTAAARLRTHRILAGALAIARPVGAIRALVVADAGDRRRDHRGQEEA